MSDTPRTDEFADRQIIAFLTRKSRTDQAAVNAEIYEYARGMERELASLQSRLAECEAEREAMRAKIDVIYDGNAVYAELSVTAHTRTSAENVSDVLDAVNRIWKAARKS